MFCSIWIIHNQYPYKTVFPLNNRIRLFWKHPEKISDGLVLFLRRWAACFHCLFDMGSISEWTLSMGFLSLSLLCTVVWIRLVAFFAGISDPMGSSRISAHMILLPKGLLPVTLSDTIGLRIGRKTSELSWWTVFASVPESALLFLLPRSCLLSYSQLRCRSLVLFEDGLGVEVGTVVLFEWYLNYFSGFQFNYLQ